MAVRREALPVFLFLLLVAAVFALDQHTKTRVLDAFSPGTSLPVVESFFSLTLVHNEGGAFGLFATLPSPYQNVFLLVLPLAAIVMFVAYFLAYARTSALLAAAFGLIVGGALGNLLDRIALGYVVDFFDFHWYDGVAWPTFNVADSAVTVGAGLLLLDYLMSARRAGRKP
jgi:signal peptidase II